MLETIKKLRNEPKRNLNELNSKKEQLFLREEIHMPAFIPGRKMTGVNLPLTRVQKNSLTLNKCGMVVCGWAI